MVQQLSTHTYTYLYMLRSNKNKCNAHMHKHSPTDYDRQYNCTVCQFVWRFVFAVAGSRAVAVQVSKTAALLHLLGALSLRLRNSRVHKVGQAAYFSFQNQAFYCFRGAFVCPQLLLLLLLLCECYWQPKVVLNILLLM